MNTPRPRAINLFKNDNVLEIVWNDGRVCRYPLPHLREACPCAVCRGGHANMGREHDPEDLLALTPARSYGLTGLEQVGNYALQPIWDDGHNSGLYTWDYLYRLCPADEEQRA